MVDSRYARVLIRYWIIALSYPSSQFPKTCIMMRLVLTCSSLIIGTTLAYCTVLLVHVCLKLYMILIITTTTDITCSHTIFFLYQIIHLSFAYVLTIRFNFLSSKLYVVVARWNLHHLVAVSLWCDIQSMARSGTRMIKVSCT